MVFDSDHLLLLVRKVSDFNRWTLPGAWVDVGEIPAEAIRRETYGKSFSNTFITKLAAV